MMMNVKRQLSLIKVNLAHAVCSSTSFPVLPGVGCQVGKLRLIDGYVQGFYRPDLNLI